MGVGDIAHMSFLLSFLLASQVVAVPPVAIAPARLEAELAADADVLRSLNENGDVPSIVRQIDVRFVGSPNAIRSLERAIGALGWNVVQRTALEDGNEALDVQRQQTTERAAIRQLTESALRIEAQYGVRYDGWGTVATTRR